jgi:DNA polymerase III subunit delta'
MWDLVGHEQATQRLSLSLQRGRFAHAYLLTGPARVGKTTLAYRLAQALNCAEPQPPCRQCRSCRHIQTGNHPDVRLLQLQAGEAGEDGETEGREGKRGSKNKKNLGIDAIREVIREAALSPYEARFKVYAVLNAETLSADAANSILKLLEEPPPQVVLLLTAADANMLLPTVVSRCQEIRLQPVPTAKIAAHLRQQGVEPEKAELLARLSGGRPGWAIDAAADDSLLAERQSLLKRMLKGGLGGTGERVTLAGQLAADFSRQRQSVELALELWTSWWRDVLLVQAGAADLVGNLDRIEDLQAQAGGCSPARVRSYLARIETARLQLEQNVNPRLAFEALLLASPATGTL